MYIFGQVSRSWGGKHTEDKTVKREYKLGYDKDTGKPSIERLMITKSTGCKEHEVAN